MQCIGCDYLLFNLPEPICPECGRGFDVESYRFKPGEVSFHCPNCDQEYYGNDANGLPYPREFLCVKCQKPVTLGRMRVVPMTPEAMGESLIRSPWDRRKSLGFWPAWWATFKMTLLHPSVFFRCQFGRSVSEAWLFSMTSMYIGMIPYFLYQTLIMWGLTSFLSSMSLPPGAPAGAGPAALGPLGPGFPMGVLTIVYGLTALVAPLIAPFVGGAILSATTQLALVALAPKRKTIDYTFRTVLYSFGPYALYVVPICGAWAGGIWPMVTMIIGIKEVHGISGWRAAVAVLWPIVALFCLYIAIIVMVVAGSIR